MQRFIIALMAIGSLLMTNLTALRAQDEGQAVDPARGRQAIDEPVSGSQTMGTSQLHMADTNGTHESAKPTPPATGGGAEISSQPVRSAPVLHIPARVRKHGSWFDSQLALLLLGLLGAGLTVIATPNAAKRVADHVSSNPRWDFIVGGLVGAGLLVILIADAILLKLPLIKLFWAPIGIMVAFAPLLILGFGWMASMRWAGDCVARKMNRSGDGSTFGRISLGLFAFFVVNVVAGSICHGLGVMCLCTEILVALMGLGATAVIAAGRGFGRKA